MLGHLFKHAVILIELSFDFVYALLTELFLRLKLGFQRVQCVVEFRVGEHEYEAGDQAECDHEADQNHLYDFAAVFSLFTLQTIQINKKKKKKR